MSDGDLRMLGAVDGYAHAIVRLRQEIGARRYYALDKRHTRKQRARDEILKPLIEIEKWLMERHRATKHAYTETCKATPTPTETRGDTNTSAEMKNG